MRTLKIEHLFKTPNSFTGITEYPNGTKKWFKNGNLHREDGPACEYAAGDKYWFKNGNLHREDGPAIEWRNGSKAWCLERKYYKPINLKDFVALDYYKGKFGIMWYKLLDKDQVLEYPDIPGLIEK